jgi:predicted lipoprotein with Yx(FWY)xxD motif
MAHRPTSRTDRDNRNARHTRRVLLPSAVLALMLGVTAIALAAKTGSVVSSAHNSSLGEQVVVDGHGDTLYALSPETTHHLLCKSTECLHFWPPLTVGSHRVKLKAGPGVKGKLGLLRRKHGVFQLTLRGMPLYRFSGDSAPGDAGGQGIKSFGGTWHAATATSGARQGKGGFGTPGAGGSPNNGYENPATGTPGGASGASTTTATSTSTTATSTMTTSTYTYSY